MKTTINNKNEKKWERIRLKKYTREDGSRPEYYYLGTDGREYFRYEDRTGYVIREAAETDTEEWFVELENAQHLYDKRPAFMRVLAKANFASTVEKGIGEDKKHKIFFIYNPVQEMVGIMHVTEGEKEAIAKIELAVKNQWMIDAKGNKIVSVIKRMWEETFIYDRMYMINGKDKKVFLDQIA